MADETDAAQMIADFLFRDGTHRQADRLLLITEDYSGKATVTDAQYLGGWSKAAVRDAVANILKQQKDGTRLMHQVAADALKIHRDRSGAR